MDLVKIHDKIEAFLNKKLKVKISRLPQIKTNNWQKAQIKAKTIELKPGWAIFFVRREGFVDHIAIVPNQEKHKLNLAEAELLNAAPPPIGQGVGPLTTLLTDQSGLRICTAIEYINLFEPNYYSMIFVGEPPTHDPQYLRYAGLIAEQIAKTGLIDGKPIVYTFSNVPFIKKYFISDYDSKDDEIKISSIKKLKMAVVPLYCGGLVGEILKRANIVGFPEIKFLSIKGPTSFSLFNWMKKNKMIKNGLSWETSI